MMINPNAKVDNAFVNRDGFDRFIAAIAISVPVVPSNLKDERANVEEV